jgi:maltooligosyltrehalose trehalohydrolase
MSETPITSPASSHSAQDLTFGARLTDDGQTRFRFWAPSRERVALELDGGPTLDMHSAGNGWFEAQADVGAGARYRFRLDDLAVPDPASRFQPQDVHGWSQVVDPNAYTWRHADWKGRPWEETVLYELHAGTLGGYAGIARQLPALAELGVTAIELMPIADFSGKRNWGYDGVLPYAPDSAYGTPDELKALIDTAHGRGMQVFLDVVYNHFGPDGNYLPVYAKSFFREGVDTPWGPAIDFERPEVRSFFFDNALYWLNEYRFDGLRLDAVHAINDDHWLRELAERVRCATAHGRHVHLVLENERNTASLLEPHYNAQWSDDAHNTMHVLLTGETESYYEAFAGDSTARLARLLSEGFVYQGDPSPIHDGEKRGEPSGHLSPTAFVFFLQNHDQVGNRAFGERLITLAEPDALRAATALMLLSPQIPLLFMGEEWGSKQPFLFFTDYEGELADAVREGRRREFAKFSAFSDEKRRASIPDPNDERTFADSTPRYEERAQGEHLEWLHFYKSALAVRAQLVAPLLRGARALGATVLGQSGSKAVLARWRLAGDEVLTIGINLGKEAVALDSLPEGKVIFETPPRARDRADAGELPGAACIVWRTGHIGSHA